MTGGLGVSGLGFDKATEAEMVSSGHGALVAGDLLLLVADTVLLQTCATAGGDWRSPHP